MGRTLPLGNSLEGLQDCIAVSPHHPSPRSARASHSKMILEVECITILHVCLFLFIIKELVSDHGFKKLVVVKEGGCLPLVLGCRTGPCLFNGVIIFLPFILLSVFKRREHRDCSFIPLVKFQIHSFL